MSGVTLGALNTEGRTGKIDIGDNVYIGSGAKIIGNLKIRNNVMIGANAVVLKDILLMRQW